MVPRCGGRLAPTSPTEIHLLPIDDLARGNQKRRSVPSHLDGLEPETFGGAELEIVRGSVVLRERTPASNDGPFKLNLPRQGGGASANVRKTAQSPAPAARLR
jgi:hypothetical protein